MTIGIRISNMFPKLIPVSYNILQPGGEMPYNRHEYCVSLVF